jgi:hypothetical protein
VDVYAAGKHRSRIRTCMPPKLDAALREQKEAYVSGRASNSQQSYPLVSDGLVLGDTVFLVGPVRDAGRNLHVDKFTLDGAVLGSVLIPLGKAGFPADLRFWGKPERLIAYGPQGTLVAASLLPEGK